MIHNDIRSDNILLTDDGGVFFVDWEHACLGRPWLDLVFFAATVNFEGGADADRLLRDHPLTNGIPPESMDAVLLASFAAYWSLAQQGGWAYHRAAAAALLRWLNQRTPQTA